jgi:spermidine synthase
MTTSPDTTAPRVAPAALLLVGSGFAALVYQVVWTRQLTYLFGATLYAIVTVLAAFMAGLALGAWWWGRRADHLRRPIRLYAFLELGIGLAALAFPLALQAVTPLWRWGYVALADHWTVFLTLRLCVIGALLLIPTFLMGGTLPVLLRSVTGRTGSVGGHVGWLYAANTTGAVLGAAASGFLLIAHLGVAKTTIIAAAVNAAVCLIALTLDRTRAPITVMPAATDLRPEAASIAVQPAVATAILWLYGFSGAAALACQVLWNRGLIFCFELMKNTTYVFSAILTVFLIGLALGSALMSPVARRTREPLALFAMLQILLGAGVLISVGALRIESRLINEMRFLTEDEQILWGPAVLNVFLKTAAVLGAPTLIMGMLYPLANAVYIAGWDGAARRAGLLYGFNTAGAIGGALAAGFLLIPLFGITGSLRALGTVNVLIGLALVPLLLRSRAAMAALGILVLIAGWTSVRTAQLHPLNPEDTLVWYHEGRLATVSVVETPDGHRDLYVDNNGVAGTAPYILTDQKSLAHFPMLLMREPRSALTVGFGSGGACYSYSLYPELEEIHCVEITEDVLTADEYLIGSNLGYTADLFREAPNRWVHPEDPRFRLIIDDARSFIQHCGRSYDIIATDCTDLRYKTNANLYDLEYFRICREHVTDEGMVVVWMPLGGLSDDLFRCALRTFVEVFPHTSVWFMNNAPTHYVLFIGTKGPQSFDWGTLTRRLADDRVRADLDVIALGDPFKILSCFVTDERRLPAWLGDGPLNTEDFPVIEFEAPRQGYGAIPMIQNTTRLLTLHESVAPLVTGMVASEEALLARYEAAVEPIVEGLNLYRTGREFVAAARRWRDALEVNPHDAAVRRLLEFEQLRRIIAQNTDIFVDFHQWRVWNDAHQYLISVEQALDDIDGAIEVAEHHLSFVGGAHPGSTDPSLRGEELRRRQLTTEEWERSTLVRSAGLLRQAGRPAEAQRREAQALLIQQQMRTGPSL